MSHTADDFFSCILSQISQDLGLPPRLAGVTLLALGNGAPDISSVIAAVKMGQSEMALGALTGAGMFVGCVIAGRIIVLNGGAKCRGAQVRDVLFFFIAVAVVLGFGESSAGYSQAETGWPACYCMGHCLTLNKCSPGICAAWIADQQQPRWLATVCLTCLCTLLPPTRPLQSPVAA